MPKKTTSVQAIASVSKEEKAVFSCLMVGSLSLKQFTQTLHSFLPAEELGLQAKELSRLHKKVVKKEHIEALAQARSAYEKVHSEKLRQGRESHWLHGRLAAEHKRVDRDGPSIWKTKLTHVWRAIVETAYISYYSIQAAIAIWLGDTKYCKREPAIGQKDIDEMIYFSAWFGLSTESRKIEFYLFLFD